MYNNSFINDPTTYNGEFEQKEVKERNAATEKTDKKKSFVDKV